MNELATTPEFGPTLAQAAREIIAARLDDVNNKWADLDLENTETVKKLRVATRRLRAATSAFQPLYAKRKPLRHLQTKLRELTDALGATRDAAVLQTRLDEWATTKRTAVALAPLREQLAQQEKAAQVTLVATMHHLHRAELLDTARKVLLDRLPDVDEADKRYDPTTSVPIMLAVLPLLRERFAAERTARTHALETTDPLALHDERLAVKKLRYTLELVADYFPAAAPTILILKDIQTQLGDLHDCDVLIEMLTTAAAAGDDPSLTAARACLDKQRTQLLAAHLDYRRAADAGAWKEQEANWQATLDRELSTNAEELALAANLPLDDWPHARQVHHLALSLFDQISTETDERDRFILAYAALLHDAGMVGGPRQHHLLSYRIIHKTKLAGMDKQERELAALIARYHRRNLPGPKHDEFAKLDATQQARVSRLAALLRIADGLDYDHESTAHHLTISHADGGYTITVQGASDDEIIRARVKSGLFAPAFGQPVRIEAT